MIKDISLAISLLLFFLLSLIGLISFCGLIAAALDQKCGGSYSDRYKRFVVTAWETIFK